MAGGHGLLEGAATLLSSHAGPSPTGHERHSESQSDHTADSVKASQLAAGRNLSARPDITAPIQTASVEGGVPPEVHQTLGMDETQKPGRRSGYTGQPDVRLKSIDV